MDAALGVVVDSLQALPAEDVPPREALRRVLAADVRAPAPLPPFRASVKDGYAVVASSPHTPHTPFVVVADAVAGVDPSCALRLSHGQCAYVTTGAPLPPATDAVVMVERSSPGSEKGTVLFDQWVGPGADVREVGCDIQKNEVVLRTGTVIGAAELGILIGCGVPTVRAVRQVRIGVLSTGDEIVDDRTVDPAVGVGTSGKIIDSNRPMLLAAIEESLPFCEAVDLGIVEDEYAAVSSALSSAVASCDIVITSGGVSMGSRDVVKPVLADMATVHFGRVCMKPGKPLTFATFDGQNRCAIGLPGNPVSAFVCFHLVVAAAAKTLAGWSRESALGPIVDVSLEHDFRLDPERPEYHRASLHWGENGYHATSTGAQASSRLLSARSAHALVALPAGNGVMKKGTRARAYILDHPRQARDHIS